jgi:Cu/Ag efflux protein CusF
MKAVKHIAVCAVLTVGALALTASAQPAPKAATSASTASDMTDGEVRKVDKEHKQVTLKHGAIKNLGMPPMTMVFQFSDAAVLDRLQPGDKVRFRAAEERGKLVATEIQPAK